jgi:meso-butanediol dehydrogenase / (S,S)-butanediol dehydrogenase / diacetyl reductase
MSGPITVVTGGASGIGAATADLLRSKGRRVQVWDLEVDGPDSARVDVSDPAAVEAAWTAVTRDAHVDGLVNAAGIFRIEGIEETSIESWSQTIGVNLNGTFFTCRHAFPHMKGNGGGSIVNIASLAGLRAPLAPCAPYAASKGGVIALTRAIAREGAPAGVRANSISPGPIETPMTTQGISEQELEAYRSRLPIGRAGHPSEVAAVIGFLLSADASFVSGSNVEVAGG